MTVSRSNGVNGYYKDDYHEKNNLPTSLDMSDQPKKSKLSHLITTHRSDLVTQRSLSKRSPTDLADSFNSNDLGTYHLRGSERGAASLTFDLGRSLSKRSDLEVSRSNDHGTSLTYDLRGSERGGASMTFDQGRLVPLSSGDSEPRLKTQFRKSDFLKSNGENRNLKKKRKNDLRGSEVKSDLGRSNSKSNDINGYQIHYKESSRLIKQVRSSSDLRQSFFDASILVPSVRSLSYATDLNWRLGPKVRAMSTPKRRFMRRHTKYGSFESENLISEVSVSHWSDESNPLLVTYDPDSIVTGLVETEFESKLKTDQHRVKGITCQVVSFVLVMLTIVLFAKFVVLSSNVEEQQSSYESFYFYISVFIVVVVFCAVMAIWQYKADIKSLHAGQQI